MRSIILGIFCLSIFSWSYSQTEPLSAGTIGSSQTICYSTAPDKLFQLIKPRRGTGTYTYQWQYSTDKISWNNIGGETTTSYNPPELTETRWFRMRVTSGSKSSVTNSVLISVNPNLTSGSIDREQTICYNAPPGPLLQLTSPSGGSGKYEYQWQRSMNNSSWTDISGANSPEFNSPSLTSDVYYRRIVKSEGCGAVNSEPVFISVYPELSPGIVGTPQSICYNASPLRLTQLSSPSGGTGFYGFQWQMSENNYNWTNITGATLPDYQPSKLTANTYFRRTVISGYCVSVNIPVLITVNAPITAAQLHNDAFILRDTSAVFKAIITGGESPYRLYYTRNGVAQSIINNYTSGTDIPTGILSTGKYTYALTTVTDSRGCPTQVSGSSITIAVFSSLTPGSIGTSQSVCYNTVPAPLTQIAPPAGGSENYTYQWQRSANNEVWTNISGATLISYEPPALIVDTYYRRVVRSGDSQPVNSAAVLINVLPIASLLDDINILNNSSANLKVNISGGAAPYTIRYRRNGIAQARIDNYFTGTGISTGILTTGTYVYRLTSVTDADGNEACDLGTEITVTVLSDDAERKNNALVIVNSGSSSYSDYTTFIKPYLDNFGFSYYECNVNSTALPVLSNYAIIIFGHSNIYSSGYPIAELESAMLGGTGLYSLDPHLFDFSSGFNTLIPQKSVNSGLIRIPNTSHYITQYHAPDEYNPDNNSVNLLNNWTVVQRSNLVRGTDLATMSSGEQIVSLLQVAHYGRGKVVKWCGYNWVFENILGPVYGMDDLLWRGIVWAARKPFAMQGMPPFITMRVDDVTGSDGGVTDDFNWVKICNEYGLVPWCGTFNNMISREYIPTLKNLIDNNKATAFPHSFTWNNDFIYFNHNDLEFFDAAANVRAARDFYIDNGLKISNYLVPHYYEISSEALPEIKAMGGDFLGIHMLPDQHYYSDPAVRWINCGPFRLGRNGYAPFDRPVYYGGNVTLNGIEFFNCLTEIRDDGSYEWFPDNDVESTTARGIRHLRRSLNSMVLSSLFTHEYYISRISTFNWRTIISRVTSAISGYNPEYTSTDYAVRYIRARNNIRITNVEEKSLFTEISYSGTNDMDTKCYLFTEEDGEIKYHLVALPMVVGSNTVNDPK